MLSRSEDFAGRPHRLENSGLRPYSSARFLPKPAQARERENLECPVLVPRARQAGSTTSPHAGHSAQTPGLPSDVSYSMRTHASGISASHSGHRPRLDAFGVTSGGKGACDKYPFQN